MLAVVLESAVRATLIAGAVGLVLRILSIQRPSVKHTAWAMVTACMLLLPLWVAWGPQAAIPLLPAEPTTTPAIAPSAPVPASEYVPVNVPASPETGRDWPFYTLTLYALGVGVMLVRLGIGSLQVRKLVRGAAWEDGALTHPACATPITVGWLRPTAILPAGWSSWPEGLRFAVRAHEHEHIRRRDPLFQWLALLNRAVFWFHPLAWWLERRLSELAEEACDAAVLEQGHDPRDYSGYLLELSRAVHRAGARVQVIGMAMPGVRLSQRLRRILGGVRAPRVTRLRLALTGALCVAAALALAAGRLVHAQDPPRYEVATIKPAQRYSPAVTFPSSGRIFMGGQTLRSLISYAYDAGIGSNRDVTGGPGWIDRDLFSVEAQAERNASIHEHTLMLRALLEERFALQVHTVPKTVDVYALVLARSDGQLGPKVQPFPGECGVLAPSSPAARPRALKLPVSKEVSYRPPPGPMGPPWGCTLQFGGPGGFTLEGAPMAFLARMLSTQARLLGRPVVDRTGLSGAFNMQLEFAFPPPPRPGEPPPPDPMGPSLFSARENQLGLKLIPAKGTVETIVVDSAERPTEN